MGSRVLESFISAHTYQIYYIILLFINISVVRSCREHVLQCDPCLVRDQRIGKTRITLHLPLLWMRTHLLVKRKKKEKKKRGKKEVKGEVEVNNKIINNNNKKNIVIYLLLIL